MSGVIYEVIMEKLVARGINKIDAILVVCYVVSRNSVVRAIDETDAIIDVCCYVVSRNSVVRG